MIIDPDCMYVSPLEIIVDIGAPVSQVRLGRGSRCFRLCLSDRVDFAARLLQLLESKRRSHADREVWYLI